MDLFMWLIIIGVIGIMYVIYDMVFKKPKGYLVTVNYSEVVGNKIIESNKDYKGFADEKKDILHIPQLHIKRPIPPADMMRPTRAGTKKIYLMKIGIDRYAYRLPTLNNEIYINSRDEFGNIIKNEQGKPVIKKLNYILCDDVVEQDVKHWDEWMQEQNRKNHEMKKELWEKWIAPASIALMFVFGVIMIHQINKNNEQHWTKVMQDAQQAQKNAARTTENLNNVIEKITGKRVLENEQQQREEYNTPAQT